MTGEDVAGMPRGDEWFVTIAMDHPDGERYERFEGHVVRADAVMVKLAGVGEFPTRYVRWWTARRAGEPHSSEFTS